MKKIIWQWNTRQNQIDKNTKGKTQQQGNAYDTSQKSIEKS